MERRFVVRWGGNTLVYALPAGAVATLRWLARQDA